MILPEWTTLNITLTVVYTLLALSMGAGELTGLVRMRYSKFRMQTGIPSRAGMLLIYGVPFLGALAVSIPNLSDFSLVQTIVLSAVLIHFGKRCLEALFVHKYSGPVDLGTSLMIMTFYTVAAAGVAYLNRWPLSAPNALFWFGLVLFAAGILGNFWHHKLLADLRKNDSGYAIPQGGLFQRVACPHYLFEILTWLGIAILSQHLFTYLTVLGMGGYLAARSLNTLKWYYETFPNFPKARKALIPFIF